MNTVDHKRIFEDLSKSLRNFRLDMFRNIDYVDGFQYSTEDMKYMRNSGRFPIVWNLIMPQILAFVGAEESNRMSTRVEAQEPSDQHMATMLNYLMEQDNDDIDAAWEISRAAMHAAIFRYGAVMAGWEVNQKHPDGQYVLRCLDPRDVWFDFRPSELDFDKSNYIVYSRWYTPEQTIQRFVQDPGRREELSKIAAKLVGVNDLKDMSFAARYSTSNSYIMQRDKAISTEFNANLFKFQYSDYFDRGLFRVIELHEMRAHTYHYIIEPTTGEYFPIPDEFVNDREYIGKILEFRGLDERSLRSVEGEQRWVSMSAPHLDPKEILMERPYPVQGKGFAIKILPGYNFDPDRTRLRSIVDLLIDPQDLINRTLASKQLLMNQILNPDIILGPNAIDDEKDMATLKSKKPGKIINATNPADIHYKYPELGAVNIFTGEMQMARELMDATPGITPSMKGQRQSDDTGVLVTRRAMYAEAMLTPYWNNIKNFIKSIEEHHLGIIQYHMTQKRMVRQLEPNGTWKDFGFVNEYDTLTQEFKNDVTVGRYDIKLDKTKYTRSEKQQQLDKLFQVFTQSDPDTRMFLQPVLFELLGLPQQEEMVESAKLLKMRTQNQVMLQLIQIRSQIQQLAIQEKSLPLTAAVQEGGLNLQLLQETIQMLQGQQALMQLQQQPAMNPQMALPAPNQEGVVE